MVNWMGPFFKAIYRQVAKAMVRLGVHPNVITVVGTAGVMFGAIWFFPQGGADFPDNRYRLFVGVMVITFFVFLDMVDGMMARMTGKSSRFGAFLDSTLDRFADAAIFGSLAVGFMDSDRVTALAALLCLTIGSVVPYARARAEGLGIDAKMGIAARSDRLVISLVATGLVGLGLSLWLLTWVLWFLTAAALVTVLQRSWAVARASAADPRLPEPGA